MSICEALRKARHYQDVAQRRPYESHFWTARSLYFGRAAVRPERSGPVRAARPWEKANGPSGRPLLVLGAVAAALAVGEYAGLRRRALGYQSAVAAPPAVAGPTGGQPP